MIAAITVSRRTNEKEQRGCVRGVLIRTGERGDIARVSEGELLGDIKDDESKNVLKGWIT